MGVADEEQHHQQRSRSDSDLARALQAEWDNEDNSMDTSTATAAAARPSTAASSGYVPMLESPPDDVKMPATSTSTAVAGAAATASNASFDLYHYNGLIGASGVRVPRLARASINIPTFAIIGQQVPLNDRSKSGGHGAPIDEVLTSRWPDAVIQWKEASSTTATTTTTAIITPPTID